MSFYRLYSREGVCLDPNFEKLKNFDLLDDCRVVGLYTADTTTDIATSGATNLTYDSDSDTGCFRLSESGDHTDEWSNYIGLTAVFSSHQCGDSNATITGATYVDGSIPYTEICYSGVSDTQAHTCIIRKDNFNVTVTSGETTEKQIDLEKECCTGVFNFYWDEENEECKWCSKEDCKGGDLFKIILGSDQNAGAFFEEENDEDCHLEVEFDYLFKYKCDELYNCVTGSTANTIDSIFSLNVDVNIEKNVSDKTGFTGNYVTEHTEELYDVQNVVPYLNGNHNTGILFEGDNCDRVIENAKDDLGIYCGVINEDTFYSGWFHHKMTITNEAILSAITNEDIHVSFTINDWKCNFYVLADNIEINKKCEKEKKVTTTVTSCPGFDLERVEDNKKSWIANKDDKDRYFDFKDRFTDYDVDHHDLVINSKEIDLRFGIPYAVETKVKQYLESNPCLLEGTLSEVDCCCYCPVGYQNINGECVFEESVEAFSCFVPEDERFNLIENSGFTNSITGWTTTDGSVSATDNNWAWSSFSGGTAQYIGGEVGVDTNGQISQSALTVGHTYEVDFDFCVFKNTTTYLRDEVGYININYTSSTETGCFFTGDKRDESIWSKAIGQDFEFNCDNGNIETFSIISSEALTGGTNGDTKVCYSGSSGTGFTDCIDTTRTNTLITGYTSESYVPYFTFNDFLTVYVGNNSETFRFEDYGTGCTSTGITKTIEATGNGYLTFYVNTKDDHEVYIDNVNVTTVNTCPVYNVESITPAYVYGARGAYFYENITGLDYPLVDAQLNTQPFSRGFEDNSGETISAETNVVNTFWGSGITTTNGRLNDVGVWTSNQSGDWEPLNEWIGFSHCIELDRSRIYSIAIAGDDFFRLSLNNQLLVEIQNNWSDDEHSHKGWHVLPIELSAGKNLIEAEGMNTGDEAVIGIEIYSADTNVISGITSESQLQPYIVFSTENQIGTLYELGEDSGNYSCPDGYALDICDGNLVCTKIDRFPCDGGNCVEGCGDQDIDILSKIDNPVDSFVTIDDFRDELYQNLIDPRSRQTLSNYPLLRAVYDRYLNAEDHCGSGSSSFDYFQMENFSKLVGDYWIDLVEQFIPSTAIWGSTFLYGNTIFDNNKFDYRRYSLLTCCDDIHICPNDYYSAPAEDRCLNIDNTSASTGNTFYTITGVTFDNTIFNDFQYTESGTTFYEEVTNLPHPITDSGTTIVDASGNSVNVVYKDVNLWNGRLDEVGVWTTLQQGGDYYPQNEWFGFSYCLNLNEGRTYYIGIGGDDKVRFSVNHELIVTIDQNSSNYSDKNWFVFPYYFKSGLNILEFETLNDAAIASLGVEIYSSDTQTLTGVTQSNLSGHTIFNGRDRVGTEFELGENSGYSCPTGYTPNICSGSPVCTRIEELNTGSYSGKCETTNVTPLSKVGSEYVDVTQRDLSEILEPDQLAPHTTGITYMNSYDPLISYTADTTASTITNINIEDNFLNEFYVSGLTNNDIESFLLTATTSASTTVGPYFRRNDNFDYIFTGITSYLDVINTTSGSTTATTIGTVSGTTTYYSGLTFNAPECIEVDRPGVNCPYVYTVNMDVGSEFIGSVTKIPKQNE